MNTGTTEADSSNVQILSIGVKNPHSLVQAAMLVIICVLHLTLPLLLDVMLE